MYLAAASAIRLTKAYSNNVLACCLLKDLSENACFSCELVHCLSMHAYI